MIIKKEVLKALEILNIANVKLDETIIIKGKLYTSSMGVSYFNSPDFITKVKDAYKFSFYNEVDLGIEHCISKTSDNTFKIWKDYVQNDIIEISSSSEIYNIVKDCYDYLSRLYSERKACCENDNLISSENIKHIFEVWGFKVERKYDGENYTYYEYTPIINHHGRDNLIDKCFVQGGLIDIKKMSDIIKSHFNGRNFYFYIRQYKYDPRNIRITCTNTLYS